MATNHRTPSNGRRYSVTERRFWMDAYLVAVRKHTPETAAHIADRSVELMRSRVAWRTP